ncbi:Hypothetical_protein [Hexamita inflata]|uniref:Hypothetical_protein n=1 Tax=Hexamita inflata TaxID=28002 RepID=A0AA86NC45_9EUKA|nr:Hypothetical protein HINF_LOCUS4133 [Hexamita inflata]
MYFLVSKNSSPVWQMARLMNDLNFLIVFIAPLIAGSMCPSRSALMNPGLNWYFSCSISTVVSSTFRFPCAPMIPESSQWSWIIIMPGYSLTPFSMSMYFSLPMLFIVAASK